MSIYGSVKAMQYENARSKGRHAKKEGKSMDDNPYLDPVLQAFWNDGYRQQPKPSASGQSAGS